MEYVAVSFGIHLSRQSYFPSKTPNIIYFLSKTYTIFTELQTELKKKKKTAEETNSSILVTKT